MDTSWKASQENQAKAAILLIVSDPKGQIFPDSKGEDNLMGLQKDHIVEERECRMRAEIVPVFGKYSVTDVPNWVLDVFPGKDV